MAHQAHNIPWYALASHLEIHSPEIPTKENPINLYFQLNPNQENDIRHFATSFAKNIREHTACERKKYPEKYDIPGEDDILLEDAITQKISPVVYKWRQDQEWELPILVKTESSMSLSVRKLCTHDDGFKCGCAIPYGERKLSSFLRQYRDNSCYKFFTDNAEGFYNIELVKTLILYGEMDPILRVCSHPDVDYKEWQSKAPCYDTNPDAGWDMIYESALCAYLCLNILYCFPEFWDPKTQNKPADYRSTKLYQRTLRTCNWSGNTSEVPYYPHRAFFGVDDNQFRFYPHITSEFGRKYMPDIYSSSKWFFNDRDFPYGRAPFDDFLRSETHEVGYLPDVAAVALVRNALYSKGLPEELVSDIMEKAKYTVKRRLVYPDDPFHPGNWDELQKYLKYCWRLMVNFNMMADALGASINWEGLIYTFLSNYVFAWWKEDRKLPAFLVNVIREYITS